MSTEKMKKMEKKVQGSGLERFGVEMAQVSGLRKPKRYSDLN
jgi:hypothetical protein